MLTPSFLAPPPVGVEPLPTPPTFSVVIAAFQVAHLIGDAVASALAQTTPPLEVVVCDDGSTDDITGALRPYRDQIILIRQDNRGEAAAKNAAVRAASGEFVSMLDGDDFWLPERLEALGALAAVRPDLDVLTSDAYLETDGELVGRQYRGGVAFEVDDQRAAILERNFIWVATVRRSAWLDVGGFDEALHSAADWEFYFRLILAGARVGLVDEPLAHYRIWPGALSSSRAKAHQGRIGALEKMRTHERLHDTEVAILDISLARYRREAALMALEQGLRDGAPDRRRRSLQVAFGAGFGAWTRAKALLAALAPSTTVRVLERKARRGTSRLTRPVPPASAAHDDEL